MILDIPHPSTICGKCSCAAPRQMVFALRCLLANSSQHTLRGRHAASSSAAKAGNRRRGNSSIGAQSYSQADLDDRKAGGADTARSHDTHTNDGHAAGHASLSSIDINLDKEHLQRHMHHLTATGLSSPLNDEHFTPQRDHQDARSTHLSSGASVDEAAATEEKGFMGMSKSVEGMLLLNLGAALFGSNMVAIKAAEDSMSSTALSAMRFAIAALAFTPYVIRGLKLPEVRKSSVELAFWLFGGYSAQAYGLELTSAARGAFTSTFTVVAVPLLVGLSGRHVSWQTWASAVAALIGVGMLTNSGGDPTWGDALCIGSAVLFGVHKWRSESVTAMIPQTTELVAVQLAGLAVASALFTLPELWGDFKVESTSQLVADFIHLPWPALLFMGLGTTALTLSIEMNALKHVTSPVAAIIYTAEPLWGAGLAYVLLGERWGALGWVGAAIIIASSLAAQRAGRTEKSVAASMDDAGSGGIKVN